MDPRDTGTEERHRGTEEQDHQGSVGEVETGRGDRRGTERVDRHQGTVVHQLGILVVGKERVGVGKTGVALPDQGTKAGKQRGMIVDQGMHLDSNY